MTPIPMEDLFSDRPWIDDEAFDIPTATVARKIPAEQIPLLRSWRKDGLVILRNAAPSFLIDEYRRDLQRVETNPRKYRAGILHELHKETTSDRLSPEDFNHLFFRFMDFHRESSAGKQLALLEPVTHFLGALFDDDVVAMQTLTFKFGSGQAPHQDICVVVSEKPAFLAGCWLALEDVHPDAGPLAYYPGSHKIPLFDFGRGPFIPSGYPHQEEYVTYLKEEASKRSGPLNALLKKGDALIWHAALVHTGLPILDRRRTRYSLVTHYSAASAYRRDRRRPDLKPLRYGSRKAFVYMLPCDAKVENTFPEEWHRPIHWRHSTERLLRRAKLSLSRQVRDLHRACSP
ncbi:MAG: phytanoyl-CoA dioxygenase family protein [Deltaproteobacteria bacterium]|nr:phytanoyl-CoA dioxygenase family protein [Deltaproteobacteria bacterium]